VTAYSQAVMLHTRIVQLTQLTTVGC